MALEGLQIEEGSFVGNLGTVGGGVVSSFVGRAGSPRLDRGLLGGRSGKGPRLDTPGDLDRMLGDAEGFNEDSVPSVADLGRAPWTNRCWDKEVGPDWLFCTMGIVRD